MEEQRRHIRDSLEAFLKLGWVRQSVMYDPLEIPAEGFDPVKRRPNPASQYNRNLWPPITCAPKKKCNKGEIGKLFNLNDKDDIIDLCYVTRNLNYQREAKQYLISQLMYRSWEKHGGPEGVKYSLARKAELATNRTTMKQAGAVPMPSGGDTNTVGSANARKTTPKKAAKKPTLTSTTASRRKRSAEVTPVPCTPVRDHTRHGAGTGSLAMPTPSTPSNALLSLVPSTPIQAAQHGLSEGAAKGARAAYLPTPSRSSFSPARRLFQDACHIGSAGPSTPTPNPISATSKGTSSNEVIELSSDEEDVFSTPKPKISDPITPKSHKKKTKRDYIHLGDIDLTHLPSD